MQAELEAKSDGIMLKTGCVGCIKDSEVLGFNHGFRKLMQVFVKEEIVWQASVIAASD